MPENTADKAMNSHWNCVAIIRASVVLPTPGRPPQDHRMRLPGLERQAQRLARPEQMLLADHLIGRLRAQLLGQWGGSVNAGVGKEITQNQLHAPENNSSNAVTTASPNCCRDYCAACCRDT